MSEGGTQSASGGRRLLLSAFGINQGGGLVLLNALLPAVAASLRAVLLDVRVQSLPLQIDAAVSRRVVRRSFMARWSALRALGASAVAGDTLFCFNSLPPLRRLPCRVVNFVHAPHFADAHRGISYAPLTRLRIAIERLWFRHGVRNCDEIWVQTPTMAAALRAQYPKAQVFVVPFVDDELITPATPAVGSPADAAKFSFFYPADDVGHKNQRRLLAAWLELARDGLAPLLKLTLDARELAGHLAQLGVATPPPNVIALGRLPRRVVLEQLRGSSALIFPSLAETFGIPLIEATALGIPVLASERDFVRDVSAPRESFDPNSPRSIAAAVRRFMNLPVPRVQNVSATDVARRLVS